MKTIDAEDLFLTNLFVIDRAIGHVCHRNHVRHDEEEEFGSYVKFKMIEGNYAAIRKFEGRSSFATYITTVIHRMFLQNRVQMWGKWRPSAEAKRIGDKGITVERMLTRDGYTYAEAVSILTTGSHPTFSIKEIEAIYLRLPLRQPRPVLVSTDDATGCDSGSDAGHGLFSGLRIEKARRIAAAADRAIASLDPEDQIVLRMRFWGGRKIPDIGRTLGIDDRKLYKRIDKLLAGLKRALEGEGVAAEDAAELLTHSDHDLSFAFSAAEGRAEIRLSKPVNGLGDAKSG